MKLLEKIIPMLSSDKAGEVASAATQIARLLKEDGKDWFWLGKLAAGGGSSSSSFEQRQRDYDAQRLSSRISQLTLEMYGLRDAGERLRADNKRLLESNASLQTQIVEMKRRERRRIDESQAGSKRRSDPEGVENPWRRRARMIMRDPTFAMNGKERKLVATVFSRSGLSTYVPSSLVMDGFNVVWKKFRQRGAA